jgi:hypothetical protein
MNTAVRIAAQTSANDRRPWYKNEKLDQWLCFWCVPVFYNIFGIVFVPLSWMMPPRSPSNSTLGVVEFMQSRNLLLACTILTLAMGLTAVGNAVYLTQIKRMSVSPIFRFTFLAGSISGAIVGCLFPMFCFGLGAFRSGYRPEILAMLYDFGYLAYMGSLGCFCVNWAAMGLAILLDKNNILPKWLGYYTIWQYMTELFAAPMWIAKSGPFAWNGLLAFWFDMVIYVPWQFIVYLWIYKAIKRQPEAELESVRIRAAKAKQLRLA